MTKKYRTRAPVQFSTGWHWIEWEHVEPSGYAACIAKRDEIGAECVDVGQRDTTTVDVRYGGS